MISDIKSKHDLLDHNNFITFLQAITLLSFPPSVFLPLLSPLQEHELSYGFWCDLILFHFLLLLLSWGFVIPLFFMCFFQSLGRKRSDILCVQSLFLSPTSGSWKYQTKHILFSLHTAHIHQCCPEQLVGMFKVPITASTQAALTQLCFYSWALFSSSLLRLLWL